MLRGPSENGLRAERILLLPLLLSSALSCVGCSGGDGGDVAATEAPDLQRLDALGYVNRVPVSEEDRSRVGVVHFDERKAYRGLSLYNSRSSSEAHLIAMDGEVVHTWSSDAVGATLEGYGRLGAPPSYMAGWNHVVLDRDGDLIVIGSHHMLLRLDWNSRIEWKRDLAAHHDVAIDRDGDLHVLVDVPKSVRIGDVQTTVLDNQIAVLTPDGRDKRRLSLLDALLTSPRLEPAVRGGILRARAQQHARLARLRESLRAAAPEERVTLERRIRLYEEAIAGNTERDSDLKSILFHDETEDVLHSNSVFVLSPEYDGPWKAGDWMLCIRNLNVVVVVDSRTLQIRWAWGESELDRPHHATQVANGNLLVFDNGSSRGFSRVLEVDPRSGAIVWDYRGDPPGSFFTDSRGGCQKLPNDNVLISETNRGYAFEVTRAGEVVWGFFNPDLLEERGGIYRMTRIPFEAVSDLLPSGAP